MLTIKQENFVQNLINGMSQREAYKNAYNAKYKDEVIDVRACELFNSSKVQVRYNELIKQLEDKSIMSAKKRMEWLTNVVNGIEKEESYYYDDGEKIIYTKEADINTKIKALDTLNKMDGQYTTKFEGSIGVSYEEALKKVSGADEY